MKKATPVWLETTTIKALSATPDGKQWLDSHHILTSSYHIADPAFDIRFVAVDP